MFSVSLIWLCLWAISAATSTFDPVRPPAMPLAVRNPYLNANLPAGSDGGGNGGYLAGEWPTFWNSAILGWAGMIRVDGTNYIWMGDPTVKSSLVNQTSYEYTSTRSIFTMDINHQVTMVIEFLSPVYPTDLKKQGFPVSYMDVKVFSIDGKKHFVQLYTDISAEWISGDRSNVAEWQYGVVKDKGEPTGMAYHQVYRQEQQLFSEVYDQTEYGNWYYATANHTGLTYQTASDEQVRHQFVAHGHLTNTESTNYRPIEQNFPVFGFARDLGRVGPSPGVSTVFTMNLAQNPVIRFEGLRGNVSVPGLWTSYFKSDLDAVKFFYDDYRQASQDMNIFDENISKASIEAAGPNYAALTMLATRQAFATTQLAGTPDKPKMFLKEISSDGNVNTVDVIFPFHPIALYLNPNLLKYLLDPLFENQEAGDWAFKFSIHDTGALYPNATGHNGDKKSVRKTVELMPLEECGNMIIMTLAYAQRANDNAYLKHHYKLLKQWNTYLIKEALYPRYQISTDDFAGALANQTNLAIKGIIGIRAMAEIAERVGEHADAKNYTEIANRYYKKWIPLGNNLKADPPHSILAYHMKDTHGLLYNIYADKELGLNFIPESLYEQQSNFYPTVARKFGVPLDTRHLYTKADWMMFCAAIASKETRNMFIDRIKTWLGETPTQLPFADLFQTGDGNWPGGFPNGIDFTARPVVGGMYSILALGT